MFEFKDAEGFSRFKLAHEGSERLEGTIFERA
jgi:hypothetical protein